MRKVLFLICLLSSPVSIGFAKDICVQVDDSTYVALRDKVAEVHGKAQTSEVEKDAFFLDMAVQKTKEVIVSFLASAAYDKVQADTDASLNVKKQGLNS